MKIVNEQSQSISVSVKDFVPSKAADIANAVVEEYQIYGVEKESEGSKNILAFIDAQLNNVFYDLKASENNIESFQKSNNYISNNVAKSTSISRFSTVEDQLLKLELDEMILSELQKNLQNNKSIDTYQLISLLAGTEEESSIRSITNELQKLLIEKENLLYLVTPNSDAIKQANFQIETQKKLLIESLSSYRNKTKFKYQNLKEKSNKLAAEFEPQPDKDMEYSRLMRLFSINEKYYTLLLEKKTEFSISNAGYVSKTIILEKANVANSPVSPSKKTATTIGLLCAFLLSFIVIIIRYLLHDQIISLNEITKQTHAGVSILGIIPSYDKDIPTSQLVVDKNPKSIMAESFRSIRTNLQFISNDPGSKIIALTSTISGEGKTFVALNLAGIIAYSGKKVVIIDLDMRKPKIHKGFGTNNERGMSTLLIGGNTIAECINKSTLSSLDFITAGPIPPNPSELIISKK
ncbi:MAG: AAA family ATPase [Bacteroidetes bacterium]|nr:AAA family ATPase [Bacteroidota bacterium]